MYVFIMILCRVKHLCLGLVVLCSACGMMDDTNKFTTSASNSDWFQYAYYSSSATLEQSDEGVVHTKPLKLQ